MDQRAKTKGQLVSSIFFIWALSSCIYWTLIGQFAKTLVKDAGISEVIKEIFESEPTDPDYLAWIERQKILIPNMTHSVEPLSQLYNNTYKDITNEALIRYPDMLGEGEAACVLKKVGYTQEQADQFFNPNKKYSACGDVRRSFLEINHDNKLVLDCMDGLIPEYVIGTLPEEERLGSVNFEKAWLKYTQPTDVGDAEFVFGRCTRSRKQTIYVNKFNSTSADRARRLTELRAQEVGTTTTRPLSVMLLIFDSVSRQHLYRNFVETIDWLNKYVVKDKYSKDHTIYDFKYNNAHGENTQPNMVPMLWGYNHEYHRKRLRNFDIDKKLDAWKYLEVQEDSLYRYFQKQGFVTLFGFDTVWDFLSRSTGRKILADHVASNFWHASKKLYGYVDFIERQRCLGLQNSHQYMLDYLIQFHENYRGYNRFAYTHLSPAHEGSGTVIRTADPDMKAFFERFYEEQARHPEEDYVIIFASDHGKHSAEWDKSIEGYLENQLPMHLIFTNKELVNRLDADEILRHNTQLMTSRFDWHMTLRHLATMPYGNLDTESELYQASRNRTDSQHALSLFSEKIEMNRTCSDMDIDSYLCACLSFEPISIEDAKNLEPIQVLLELAAQIINNGIKNKDICKQVTFQEITSAEVQILKEEIKATRNYKIRANIHENPAAEFEVIGFMAEAEEFKELKLKSTESEPMRNLTMQITQGKKKTKNLQIQLKQLVRVDEYAGIWEEMAKVAGETASKWICNHPGNSNFDKETPKDMVAVVETLKMNMTAAVGNVNATWVDTCQALNKVCVNWIFPLYNSLDMFEESWQQTNTHKIHISKSESVNFKDLGFSDYKEERLPFSGFQPIRELDAKINKDNYLLYFSSSWDSFS